MRMGDVACKQREAKHSPHHMHSPSPPSFPSSTIAFLLAVRVCVCLCVCLCVCVCVLLCVCASVCVLLLHQNGLDVIQFEQTLNDVQSRLSQVYARGLSRSLAACFRLSSFFLSLLTLSHALSHALYLVAVSHGAAPLAVADAGCRSRRNTPGTPQQLHLQRML